MITSTTPPATADRNVRPTRCRIAEALPCAIYFRSQSLESLPRLRYNPAMAAEKITPEQVRQVAKLARLALSPDELAKLTPQLESILEYVDKISQLDVTNVEPMAHTLPLRNVLREDVVEPSLPLEAVLLNAPDTDGPFFKVPKIIGGDEDSAG